MKTTIRFMWAFTLGLFLMGLAVAGDVEGSRTKTFKVQKGGSLELSTSYGDVRIKTADKDEVVVNITGLDEDELDRVKMEQSGNTVTVTFRPRGGNWGGHALFEVTVPKEFNLQMKTSGGDLTVSDDITGKIEGSTAGGDIRLNNVYGGEVDMSTSGGDVIVGNLKGDGRLKTAGGDIKVGTVSAALHVSTSGGDIRVDNVAKSLKASTAGGDIQIGDVGGEAEVSTSGGDVRVGKVSGRASLSTAGGDIELMGASGRVSAKTAGGDLRLKGVTGAIDGKTAGGDIDAELTPTGQGDSKLSTAGGEVRLAIPENAKATIEATIRVEGWGRKKDRYVVRSEFKETTYDVKEDEIHAVYKLNGGGDLIRLSTVNSDIILKKLR